MFYFIVYSKVVGTRNLRGSVVTSLITNFNLSQTHNNASFVCWRVLLNLVLIIIIITSQIRLCINLLAIIVLVIMLNYICSMLNNNRLYCRFVLLVLEWWTTNHFRFPTGWFYSVVSSYKIFITSIFSSYKQLKRPKLLHRNQVDHYCKATTTSKNTAVITDMLLRIITHGSLSKKTRINKTKAEDKKYNQ